MFSHDAKSRPASCRMACLVATALMLMIFIAFEKKYFVLDIYDILSPFWYSHALRVSVELYLRI